MQKLQPPPYLEPEQFQLRARMLTNLGGIEHGKRFSSAIRSLLFSLIRTYGLFGTVAALRNMNAIQRKLLPELANLNLFANWPRPGIPIHYIFGSDDPLILSSVVKRISSVISKTDTVITFQNAGHMAHFDQPAAVRSIIATC